MGYTGVTTTAATYPIPLQVGDVITGYTVYANKGSSGSYSMTSQYLLFTGASETGQGSGCTNSAGAPGAISLLESGLSITAATATQYYIYAASTSLADTVYSAMVNITRNLLE